MSKWKHEIIALEGTPSEMAYELDLKSRDGWEVVNIFHHSHPEKFIPLGKSLDLTQVFALLRKQVMD